MCVVVFIFFITGFSDCIVSRKSMYNFNFDLRQGSATRGPRANCGPLRVNLRPFEYIFIFNRMRPAKDNCVAPEHVDMAH